MRKYTGPNFRIAVVGSGAVGSYYGAKLAYFGRDVHFLVRSGLKEIRRFGIQVRAKKEGFRLAKAHAYATPEEIGPCDVVLVALKATSNEDLRVLVPPLLHEKTIILTLQNGLGNEEFLAQNFGAERVIGGLSFICLNRTTPGQIECYDSGHIVIGEYTRYPQPRTHDLAWAFKHSGVVCRVTESLLRERWRKLVWNVPFNGLTIAAGGVTTREILARDSLRLAALGLMEEVIAAANRSGYELPSALALEQMKRTEAMGAYKPSTLLDWENGRAMEIEAIWGEPLRRARAAGAESPRLEQLYGLLQE
nr:2-dehydropantoate 2-reductase [Chthoniobacterales bacterium]